MLTLFRTATPVLEAMLDPRRIVRWVYLVRLSVAAAIFLAAQFVWNRAAPGDLRVASLGFAAAMVFTVGSAVYSEIYRRPIGRTFRYLQAVFDLLLVTAVVHVTGGSTSQFGALYILVIAAAAVLLPPGGGLLVALLGNVLYFCDVIFGRGAPLDAALYMQLCVFAAVALGSAYISAQLQEVGAGRDELAAELATVRLQAADILRNIRSGILTIDGEGNLVHANPAAAALLAMPLEHRVGKPVLDPIGERAAGLSRILRDAIRGVRTTRAEAVIELPDRSFPIGVTTTASDSDGKGLTATAIFSDISDSKRLEILHLRAQRLEAVAELSASLAHEIKNPLASIRSAVEQLSGMPAAGEDERTLSALIVRESDRLSRLLSEFLDFARVRVTRIDRVDLGRIARGAAGLAAAHPDRKCDLRLECATPEEPVIVEGDEDLLHRVVFNLALNAVQAARDGGTVRVHVAPVPASRLPGGVRFGAGAATIEVMDDGPGIAPEVRDRMFDPFITTKSGGTGLGLPVVHRAVEAHRGLVLVDSAISGTRFTVLLPYSQSDIGEDS